MSYLEQWARAFGWTLGMELVVAGFVLGPVAGALPRRMLAVLVAESWALLSEWLLYGLIFPNIGWKRSLLAATAANAASCLLGLLVVH